MTGKVFSDSSNIYQDEARVLFDYYRSAAERIVAEEEDLETRIGDYVKNYQEATAKAASAQKTMIVMAVLGVLSIFLYFVVSYVSFIVAAVFAFLAFNQYSTASKEQAAAAEYAQTTDQLNAQLQAVRRDYRIDKVGVAYVPVARRVAIGDRSFVLDCTGEQPDTELVLTLLNQPGELREAMETLHEHLETMPSVESNDDTEQVDTSDYSTSMQDMTLHDYMGTIDRQVRNVRYLISDSRDVRMSMPAVPPSSEQYRFLSEYATTETGSYPIVPVFDVASTQQTVQDFSNLMALNQQSADDGSGDVSFFTDVMRQLAQGVDMVARSRTASVSSLTNYSLTTLGNVLKASYNQYSPTLEAEEIERIKAATFNYADEVGDYQPFSLKESSRVHFDLFGGAWVADNGARTAIPFGMHQVEAEVLMPVIANLMEENRVERMRIYNDIQNQKIDYLNQWHRDTDDFYGRNRSEANELFQRMNEAYAVYTESYTNYQQQRATLDAMKVTQSLEQAEVMEADNEAEVIEGFMVQATSARERQDEFAGFMERVREDIDESAERFGHIEYYEASLRDSHAQEIARAIEGVRDLDRRRLQLASVNAYLAQEGAIPPAPQVSGQLDEDFSINLVGKAESEIASLGNAGHGPQNGQ